MDQVELIQEKSPAACVHYAMQIMHKEDSSRHVQQQ